MKIIKEKRKKIKIRTEYGDEEDGGENYKG